MLTCSLTTWGFSLNRGPREGLMFSKTHQALRAGPFMLPVLFHLSNMMAPRQVFLCPFCRGQIQGKGACSNSSRKKAARVSFKSKFTRLPSPRSSTATPQGLPSWKTKVKDMFIFLFLRLILQLRKQGQVGYLTTGH